MAKKLKNKVINIDWIAKRPSNIKKIDEKDRKLLKLLLEDSRASLKQLGKKLRLSKAGVFLRVRKLEEIGAITGYSTFTDFTKLGLEMYNIGIKTIMTLQEKEEYVKRISSLGFINQILLLSGGRWDFLLRIVSARRSVEQNLDLLSDGKIQDMEILQIQEGFFFSEPRNQVTLLIGGEEEPYTRKDILLLRALAENSKETISSLSHKVGCDSKTIIKMIGALKQKGILRMCISGHNPFIYGCEAYLLVITTKTRSIQKVITAELARVKSTGNIVNLQEPSILSFHFVENFNELKNVELAIKPFLDKIRQYEFIRVEEQTSYNMFPDDAYKDLLENAHK